MENALDVSQALRSLIGRYAAGRAAEARDETPLGPGGLGLDSIAIAEVLLECQTRLGVDAMPLLDGSEITFGRLVELVRIGVSR